LSAPSLIGDAIDASQVENAPRYRYRCQPGLRRQPHDFRRSGSARWLGSLRKNSRWQLEQRRAFETYAIYGAAQRGIIELNGATAHLGKIGDRITIMSFARYAREEAAIHQPRIVVLNDKNEIVRYEGGDSEPALKVVGE
jgi:hypothetical protein